jgi:hypothetical protein
MTGEEAILAFVNQHGRATTAEINAHWRSEGRGGVANNAIVRLLKRGELVREPVPGTRGSYYRCQSPDPAHSMNAAHPAATPVAAGPH